MPLFISEEDARALAEERNSRHFRLLEEMKPSDLATLIEMLVIFTGAENGLVFAAKVMGEAHAIMRIKHGDMCGGCGEKHVVDPLEEERRRLQAERAKQDPDTQAALKEYNMEFVDDRLFCSGCGLEYVSLEDRMLKPPGIDGCHGCQHKSAHGG